VATSNGVRAEVGGLPEQDWSLRVTQVFRRDGGSWQLVHRHADPLVKGITVEQAAALARGGEALRASGRACPELAAASILRRRAI
jgi:hypothetical protein